MSAALEEIIRKLPGYDPFYEADGYRFDAGLAFDRIAWWEQHIVHIEGDMAGKPYRLEEHEVAILANIFGWVSEATGLRRFRQVLYYVPRKNSKTTFAAALCVLLLFTEPDWRMQMFSCGSDGEQAAIIYDIMVEMIERNPELEKRVHIYKSPRRIVLLADRSQYRSLSAKAKTKHGKNPNFVVYDETHTYPNGDLIEAMHTGMVNRKQPLEIHTTTAAEEGENVLNQILHDFRQVRDQEMSGPTLLPVIYEVPKAMREADPLYWTKEEAWKIANPLYGKAVQPEYFREEVRRAMGDPQRERSFKRLHLNVQTTLHERMIETAWWQLNDGCHSRTAFEGQECAGAAIDLGMTSDLCSLCLLFGTSTRGYKALWWHWIPEEAARIQQKKRNIPYDLWQNGGWVRVTPGNEIDYDQIYFELCGPERDEKDAERRKYRGIFQRYKVCAPPRGRTPGHSIAVDRAFQGAALCQKLIKRGYLVEEFGQGFYSMAGPTASWRNLIRRGLWSHGDDPCMRWQSGNVVAETDAAGNLKPSKAKSYGKIDGIMTGIMATAVALKGETGTSAAYERSHVWFVQHGRRFGKFWISAQELAEIEACASEAERDEVRLAVFARHGYLWDPNDVRPNPNDPTEFIAQALR